MRGSTPPKRQKHRKIGEKQPKHTQNYPYISIFLWTRTGELRNDLDAPERAPENLDPKKPAC